MTAIERRIEMLNILAERREEKISNLADEFNVCVRTIKYDIEILSRDHPIETVVGRYGCVRMMPGCRIYQNDISIQQQEFLLSLAEKVDASEKTLLLQLLRSHGSVRFREAIEGGLLQ